MSRFGFMLSVISGMSFLLAMFGHAYLQQTAHWAIFPLGVVSVILGIVAAIAFIATVCEAIENEDRAKQQGYRDDHKKRMAEMQEERMKASRDEDERRERRREEHRNGQ